MGEILCTKGASWTLAQSEKRPGVGRSNNEIFSPSSCHNCLPSPGSAQVQRWSVLLTNSTDPATQIQKELLQLKKLAIEHPPTTNTIHTEERKGLCHGPVNTSRHRS